MNNCCKAQVEKSSVAKHLWEQNDNIKWDQSKLITSAQQTLPRRVRESIEVLKHNTVTQDCYQLSVV